MLSVQVGEGRQPRFRSSRSSSSRSGNSSLPSSPDGCRLLARRKLEISAHTITLAPNIYDTWTDSQVTASFFTPGLPPGTYLLTLTNAAGLAAEPRLLTVD